MSSNSIVHNVLFSKKRSIIKPCFLRRGDEVTGKSEGKPVSVRIFMPEDIRTVFKSECVLENVSMSEKAVELIQEWINNKGKLATSKGK